MAEFLIPAAIDEGGRLVLPSEANRETAHRCPACLGSVVLHRGNIKRPHYAHRASAVCSPETVLHRTAKILVAQIVADWKAGRGERPILVRKAACGCVRTQLLPDKVDAALLETPLPDGLVPDVTLLSAGNPVALIEILATHKVPSEKAARLALPWMELDARAILDHPFVWEPIRDHLRRAGECPECRRRIDGIRYFKAAGYRVEPWSCYWCKKNMVVYRWPGHTWCSRERPPRPIPPTVRLSTTIGGRRYWANTCPECSAVQGDWLLYDEHGVFDVRFFGAFDPWCGHVESRPAVRFTSRRRSGPGPSSS